MEVRVDLNTTSHKGIASTVANMMRNTAGTHESKCMTGEHTAAQTAEEEMRTAVEDESPTAHSYSLVSSASITSASRRSKSVAFWHTAISTSGSNHMHRWRVSVYMTVQTLP